MSFLQRLFRRPQEPDSVHGEMYRLDVVEDLLKDAIRAYQSLLEALAAHIPKTARDAGQEHSKRLKQIRNLLDSTPTRPLIGSVRQQMDRAVDQFANELDLQLGRQEQEAKQVMAIVAVMAESMADREKQYNVRFRGIGKKLRVLSTSNDLAEIRRKLEAEVAQLEKYVDDMAKDTQSAVSRLQMELRQVHKPEPVEASAPAIAGRREAEQAIESRCKLDLRFCAARFSIDNIPAVAAQFGLAAASGLLEQVATVIRQQFEEMDLVCRWSDQDLVVVTDVVLPEVAMRVADLEETLAGPYTSGNREVTLSVRTCVIERLRGEATKETVGRIDSMLLPAIGKR